ncbi:hypothetical protein [Alcaligenes sp. YSL9]
MPTEQVRVQLERILVKWHGLQHLRDMGRKEIERFLSMLTNERPVSLQLG